MSELPSPAHSVTTFIARQPIFDRRDRVFAYELLFRNSPDNYFPGTEADLASSQNLENSLMTFGLETLTAGRRAFVNVSRGVLLDELYTLLPTDRTVIELLETVEPDADVVEACRRLKRQGYQLALDDFAYRAEMESLLDLADVLKLDFRAPAEVRAEALKRAQGRNLDLLAEKVETRAERDEAEQLGFRYFQGYYYCRPEMLATRTIAPGKLNYLQLLGEINAPEVQFERVEQVIRREVALSVRLLRYLNSAGFGWRYEVKTIEQAIRLLGIRPLQKWASLMAVIALADGKPPELVVTALVRARLAELLAGPLKLAGRELELFLVGLLSVMDAVMDRPLEELLASMAVSREIAGALLRSGPPLGPALRLVVARQQGDWLTSETQARELGTEPTEVHRAYGEAITWAMDVAGAA